MGNYKYMRDNIKVYMGDMTPAELSRIIGLPAMTIHRVIGEETIPRIDTVDRIAKGLKIPLPAIVCENELLRHLIIELFKMSPSELHAIKLLLKR